jgi:outer membrane protein assembly factor BamE
MISTVAAPRRLLHLVRPMTLQFRTSRLLPLLLPAAALLLGGCASRRDGSLPITPYRMEVVQGNVVTREMIEQLKPGLSRDQVRNLLGSPLLTDVFHAQRWDYVFTLDRQGTAPQQRRITIHFDGEKVSRFDAAEVPSERDFVASINVAKPDPRRKPLELTPEQIKALPQPQAMTAAATAAAPTASAPSRNYPPLEPQNTTR